MRDLIELILGIGSFLVLLGLGYFVGAYIEKKHFREIQERERALLWLPAVAMKNVALDYEVIESKLVVGSVVVSVDYFKRFLAKLRSFFGGEVKSYSSLLDRARREAMLRMKEQATDSDIIVNVRLETSTIGSGESSQSKNPMSCVEIYAYGTALKVRRES